MPFFTKVDYSRQLRQYSGTSNTFSGSTIVNQDLTVGDEFMSYQPYWAKPSGVGGDCSSCSACTTGHTFMVGPYSSTSASCIVTITSFSGVTGTTPVLAIGQVPMEPLTGGSTNPGISASTIQINKDWLLPNGAIGYSAVDLQIDEVGNVVRGTSSSLRYKSNLRQVERNRYNKLLGLSQYFFTYNETGRGSFGLIAEEMDKLGYKELVIYNGQGQPDNIEYKLLSVALLGLVQDLYKDGVTYVEPTSTETDNVTKVVGYDYTTNGEYLIVVSSDCKILLDSSSDTKVKIKSLANVVISPDKGLIDNKWSSISLDGDSCVELVFVKDLEYWVVVSSDGLKDS
jgi:hypothetical protein